MLSNSKRCALSARAWLEKADLLDVTISLFEITGLFGQRSLQKIDWGSIFATFDVFVNTSQVILGFDSEFLH